MRTTHHYEAPEVIVYGNAADLTRASFNNNQQDSIFFAGVIVGNATGSMDACVSENPESPSGQCEF